MGRAAASTSNRTGWPPSGQRARAAACEGAGAAASGGGVAGALGAWGATANGGCVPASGAGWGVRGGEYRGEDSLGGVLGAG